MFTSDASAGEASNSLILSVPATICQTLSGTKNSEIQIPNARSRLPAAEQNQTSMPEVTATKCRFSGKNKMRDYKTRKSHLLFVMASGGPKVRILPIYGIKCQLWFFYSYHACSKLGLRSFFLRNSRPSMGRTSVKNTIRLANRNPKVTQTVFPTNS